MKGFDMDFLKFKSVIQKQFAIMAKHDLFRTTIDKDSMWITYIDSFPEGSDPIYRERTEHDCSCCKSFISSVGNVVAIIDNKIVSIWDVEVDDPAYQIVADAMQHLVKSAPINNVFFHYEKTAGTDKNFELVDNKTKTYEHFFLNIPQKFVLKGIDQGPKLSEKRADHDVLNRSLKEITTESIDTVLELISQNSLYRGQEHKFVVTEFQKLKKQYNKLLELKSNEDLGDLLAWNASQTVPASVCRIS